MHECKFNALERLKNTCELLKVQIEKNREKEENRFLDSLYYK